ncbi:hypothetical protein STEG23_005743 [Scotinomys teguina]
MSRNGSLAGLTAQTGNPFVGVHMPHGAENSEELEIFIDFDRWDCRRIESSREYFTEPEVLTRTLLAL